MNEINEIKLEDIKVVHHAEEWLCPDCRFPNLFDGVIKDDYIMRCAGCHRYYGVKK